MLDPLIALSGGILILFISWWLFRPKVGLVARWQQSQQKTARVLREDALKHMQRFEQDKYNVSLESIAGALQVSADQAATVVEDLEVHRLIQRHSGQLKLTENGREAALHIVRAHRLWERYLSDETGYGATEWHAQADRLEHSLSPAAANKLASQLGYPATDPHGDPIPTSTGELSSSVGEPIHQFAAGDVVRITHLEDEPETVFAQIVAEDLRPGMVVQLSEVATERVVFWSHGHEHVVAPIVAANISVTPVAPSTLETEDELVTGERLDDVMAGEKAQVVKLSPRCRGAERRRFLDLGLVPGTVVSAEFESPSGEPTCYQIRGALIALRSEQAHKIYVRKMTS